MFLKKNHAFKKGFHYNMSGLVIRAKGVSLSKYEITDVRKNSNADQAGLVEGDIITVVNGLRTSILSLNGVNSMLNSRPGKRVTITVDRKGQSIKTKFQLQDPF
jgi:C-terminal processing protease CtpA/Prc